MKLSPTVAALASMSRDDAHYWGSEAYTKYGDAVYCLYKDLTHIPRELRAVLKTVWKALWIADDIAPPRRTRGGHHA